MERWSKMPEVSDLEEKVSTWNVESHEVLVSFDVTLLYTSVPVAEALQVLDKKT